MHSVKRIAHFLFQGCCNQLQRAADSGWSGDSAGGTVATDFEPRYHNMELAIPLDLAFKPVEQIAFEFRDLPAAEAGHMNVISLRSSFVKVLFTLHVHQIQLVDETVALQQAEGAVDSDPVNLGIEPASATQKLAGVEMLLRGFNHAEDGAALASHAKSARHQLGLQSPGSFGLR
jgi:hypothetical protein